MLHVPILCHAPGKQEHNTHHPTKTSTCLFSAQSHYNLANTRYILEERKFLTSAETESFAELQVPQLQFKHSFVISGIFHYTIRSSCRFPEQSQDTPVWDNWSSERKRQENNSNLAPNKSHIPQATAQYTCESWVWCRIRYGATLALESKTTSSVPTRRPRKQRERNDSNVIPKQITGLSKNTGSSLRMLMFTVCEQLWWKCCGTWLRKWRYTSSHCR